MNNFVGKMLVVLNLVFSICFMCFAGAVYTYQQQWRDEALKVQTTLNNVNDSKRDADEKYQADLSALNDKLKIESDRAATAEATHAALTTDRDALQGRLAAAEKQRDDYEADLQIAQAESDSRNKEAINLRGEVKNLLDRINLLVAERRTLEDTSLELTKKVAGAAQREVQLLSEIGRLEILLRVHEVDPQEIVIGSGPDEIVKVDGKVKATQKNSSKSQEFVLISVGTDDRIVSGMKLHVYRKSTYVCQIVITDVRSDEAVGLVLEETRNAAIERDDYVTTKL